MAYWKKKGGVEEPMKSNSLMAPGILKSCSENMKLCWQNAIFLSYLHLRLSLWYSAKIKFRIRRGKKKKDKLWTTENQQQNWGPHETV